MKKQNTKLQDWQRRLGSSDRSCVKCGRMVFLTVDHIIPVNMLVSLNLEDRIYDWDDNFQELCKACNQLKGGQLDLSNPKTMRLLKEAIMAAEAQIQAPITTQVASGTSKAMEL